MDLITHSSELQFLILVHSQNCLNFILHVILKTIIEATLWIKGDILRYKQWIHVLLRVSSGSRDTTFHGFLYVFL